MTWLALWVSWRDTMIRGKDFYSDFQAEQEHIENVISKHNEDIDPGEEATIANLERQQTRLENEKMAIQQDIESKQKEMENIGTQIARLQSRIASMKAS